MNDGHGTAPLVRALWLLVCGAAIATGCNPDVQDGAGPIIPVPNVTGAVVRDQEPADALGVELRHLETAEVMAATETDGGGRYDFADVPAGDWEIKVSSGHSGDFGAVSRVFALEDDGTLVTVPVLDIDAYGAALVAPEDRSSHPVPDPFNWLTFRWLLPERAIESARVQLYDAVGESVWSSEKHVEESVAWNGIGNQGDYSGVRVTAGSYRWRVKLEFSDGTEARLDSRGLELQ